jgi:hypothetical protein
LSKKRPYWTTNKYKRLAATWDKRLAREGLGLVDRDHAKAYEPSDEREVYYRMMGSHVAANCEFDTPIDKYVLTQYVSGVMLKDIVKGLKLKGFPRDRSTLRWIIRKYENRWGVRRWVHLRRTR